MAQERDDIQQTLECPAQEVPAKVELIDNMPEDTDVEATPQQRVLETTELLEQILLPLPVKDLFLNQRVCVMWKNCIDSSSKLQRGLFLQPAGEPIPYHERELDLTRAGTVAPRRRTYIFVETRTALLNPLLLYSLGLEKLAERIAHELDESTLPARFRRPEASWRRMRTMQPPLPEMMLSPPTTVPRSMLGEPWSRHLRVYIYEPLKQALAATELAESAGQVDELREGVGRGFGFIAPKRW